MQLEDFAIFAALFFGFLSVLGTSLRVRVRGEFDVIDALVLSLGLTGGFGNAYVTWATAKGLNPDWENYIHPSTAILYVLAGSIVLLSSWIGVSILKPHSSCSTERTALRSLSVGAWVLLITGVSGYFVYTLPYGGPTQLLDIGRLVRVGFFEKLPENPLSYLAIFGRLAWVSTLIFIGLLLNRFSLTHMVGFLLSFFVSLYTLFVEGGRMFFLIFIVTILLAPFYNLFFRGGLRASISVVLAPIAAFLLLVTTLPYLTRALGRDASFEISQFLAQEISFPLIVFDSWIKDFQFRWGIDFFALPLYFLPERLWKQLVSLTVSEVATLKVFGYLKGEAGLMGAMPADLLTTLIAQFHVVGLVPLSLGIAISLLKLQRILISVIPRPVGGPLHLYFLFMAGFMMAPYGDPEHIATRLWHLLVGVLTIQFLRVLFKEGKRA